MKHLLGLFVFGLSAFGADTAALESGAPQEKAAAAQALGYARDASAVDALARAALDGDPAVARAAGEALAAIGGERAAEALLKAWPAGSPAALANALLRCAEERRTAGDTARARALYEACRESGAAPQQAAARLGLAGLDAKPAAPSRAADQLRAADPWALLAGIRASVREADPAALPRLFELSLGADEPARAATLALEAFAADGTDAFLSDKVGAEGPGRAKAIELLAARGARGLARRLCDPALYGAAGVGAAAGAAWRARLGQDDFAAALAFAFALPAERREPLVSALAAVAQQLPDPARAACDIGAQLARAAPADQADALGLLAGLPNEVARDLLAAQAKSGDAELRKAAVRALAKWSSPLALGPLEAFARGDPERSVRVLALRGALGVVQKPGAAADKVRQLQTLEALSAAAERDEEKRALCAALRGLGGPEADALRRRLAEAWGLAEAQARVVAAVNAGGGEVEGFKADAGFSGGVVYAVKLEADVSAAADAAPAAVYQSCRFRDCAYTFDKLSPGRAYALRLHFAETFHQRAGARVFDVAANGRTLLAGYDIFAKAGARMKAVTETFDVAADAAGKLVVTFATRRDHALVNGLEVLELGDRKSQVGDRKSEVGAEQRAGAAAGAVAAPKPGQIRLLLLTGANNHSWQETTQALKDIFAPATNFFVRVEERPWEMKPAALGAYDVLFCNWNTFGKDKREWSPEMKQAFEAWSLAGGGFVVLHAGASMYYDWEAFQQLTGGAWEKGTFHPHVQRFTVNVTDREHPVTRGLADFEAFDEPWQKTGNRNPARRVLLTGVVSQANKGSGEPEPFAWVTERGKGRCFNLVLGHDARALDNAACRALILRGAEWAATGAVK